MPEGHARHHPQSAGRAEVKITEETDYTALQDGDMLAAVRDDAFKWATAFCQHAEKLGHHGIDHGWMIGWFANAIEHSGDVRRWAREASLAAGEARGVAFQQRVQPWMMACFGPEISADRVERNHRFLEEALELVQANGCTVDEAHQLVDYVYGRPQGEINQEVGGVMVTLAALCLANGIDMHQGGETELARIWTKVEKIRAKQAAKPTHSPLPASPTPAATVPPAGAMPPGLSVKAGDDGTWLCFKASDGYQTMIRLESLGTGRIACTTIKNWCADFRALGGTANG